MPVISMFYGVIVSMFFLDNRRHKRPHVHVRYQEHEIVLSIPDGEVLEGSLPNNKLKLVFAWMEIHRYEVLADWELAVAGQQPYKIEPLK